jgi:glycosyltransferase involved in cell wall biosynthesis
MKIILLYDYLSEIGGVERVIATHAHWLKQAGHEVVLLFNYVSPKAKEYAFLQGQDIREIATFKKGGESFKMFSALVGFNNIKSYNPDLVIAYSFPSVFTSRKLKCKKAFYYLPMEFIYFPIKKRWEWANDGKRKVTFFASLFLAPILRIMDKRWIKNKLVIANSDFTRREIKQRYNTDSIISYPPLNTVFEPTEDISDTLKKFNLKGKFVLTAGRIVPDKKTAWLIEVFAKLKDKKLDFVVAGGIADDYKKTLIETAKKFKVEDRIKLIGLVDQKELVKLYSACEVFMFASPEEAFGLVPIEAMACGAPVVAWNDHAGPNEYVIPKVNGFLAKPYDLDNFTNYVEKVMSEKFKIRNAKQITNSMNKFSEKEQSKNFVSSIENFLKS